MPFMEGSVLAARIASSISSLGIVRRSNWKPLGGVLVGFSCALK